MIAQPVVAQPVVVQQPVVQQPVVAQSQQPQRIIIQTEAKSADPSVTPTTEAEKAMVKELLQRYRSGSKLTQPAPAQVIVNLPADASLYIDNVPCPLTSARRSFATPRLQPGQKYFYTLRAELVRDGRTITQNRRVIVSAGQQVSVNFGTLSNTPTASR